MGERVKSIDEFYSTMVGSALSMDTAGKNVTIMVTVN